MNQQIKTSLGVIIILIIISIIGAFIWNQNVANKSAKGDWAGCSCTDFDGGKDIYIEGNAVTKDERARAIHSSIDSCAIEDPDNGVQYAQGLSLCSGENCYISESYCREYKGGMIDGSEFIQCPNGCKDGACMRK
jgi:hypothetical protein